MKKTLKALLFLGLAVAASIFYFSYSIHSNYYQGVRAAESYKYAKVVSASLSKYYSTHLKYPSHLDKLNMEKTEENYIGKVIFHNQTGVVKIQLAGESLSEGALIFSPQIKNNNELSYTCHPLNVPAEHIPEGCAINEIITSSSPQSTTRDTE